MKTHHLTYSTGHLLSAEAHWCHNVNFLSKNTILVLMNVNESAGVVCQIHSDMV